MSVGELDAGEAAFDEDLTHHLASSEQAVLDRSQRQARHLGDLVVAEILSVAEGDEVAVSGGEAFHHTVDLHPPLAPLSVLLGRRARTFKLELIRTVGRFGFETLPYDGISSDVIDRCVMGDAVKPSG